MTEPSPAHPSYQLSRRGLLSVGAGAAAGVLLSATLGNPARAAAATSLTAATTVPPAAGDPAPTVIYSTSFEDPTDRTWLSAATAYDTSQHLPSGLSSLRYTRTDRASYELPWAPIPAAPGDKLTAAVSVKTAQLVGSGGATLALEAYSSTGGWLGGDYINGINPADWTQLQLGTFTVPPGTAKAAVLLYLQKGITGTAWFDDLTVLRLPSLPLHPLLASPAYRGLLLPAPGDEEQIDLRIELQAPGGRTDLHTVRVDLLAASGRLIDSRTFIGAPTLSYTYDPARLPYGDYLLRVRSLDAGTGALEQERQFAIAKTRQRDIPATYLDRRGRLVRDGKTVFPIGIYHSTSGRDRTRVAQDLDDISGSFDVVMDYNPPDRGMLDLAYARGLRCFYSIKDFFYNAAQPEKPAAIRTEADEIPYIEQIVRQYRNHPALFGWYVNDELPVEQYGRRLDAHYDAVVANDPNHPAYAVDYIVRPPDLQTRTTDAIGTDGYPVTGRPTDNIGWVGQAGRQVVPGYPNRAWWPVIQLHDLGNYGQGGLRPPTFDEVRNMSWQAIAVGATGLMYYSLFDLQRDASGVPYRTLLDRARTVVDEIRGLGDVILSADRLDGISTASSVLWTTRVYQGRNYLFVVNPGYGDQGRTVFTIPGLFQARELGQSRWQAVDGTLMAAMPALAVRLYELKTLGNRP